MTRNPVLLAQRLRVVTMSPEYRDTLETWMREEQAAALHDMTKAQDLSGIHKAQGRYAAYAAIFERIEKVFVSEQAALKKADQKNQDRINSKRDEA